MSLFEIELTETEKLIRSLNQEMEIELPKATTYVDKLRLAKLKLAKMRETCLKKAQDTEDKEERTRVPDFDPLRKNYRNRILKNQPKVEAPQVTSDNPKSKYHRMSKVNIHSVESSSSRKKSRRIKAPEKKMSNFTNFSADDPDNIKKRNSDFLRSCKESMAGNEVKKSRFAPQTPKLSEFAEQRDSMDITNTENFVMRHSTLAEMRSSLFKFDTSILAESLERKEELQIDEIVSDVSSCDLDAEELEDEVAPSAETQQRVTRLQLLQTEGQFLSPKQEFNLNMVAAFEADVTSQSHLFQRCKMFDTKNVDLNPSLYSLGGALIEDKIKYSPDNQEQYLVGAGVCQPDDHRNTLLVQQLSIEDERARTHQHYEKLKSLIGTSVLNCYQGEHYPDKKFSFGVIGNNFYGFKLYESSLAKYFESTDLFAVSTEGDHSLKIATKAGSVYFNLEMTKQLHPILLKAGDEFYFNRVDGIRVESVLNRGFTDEEFEAFKPKGGNWDIECFNRQLNEESIYKFFLLSQMGKKEKADIDQMDQVLKECLDKSKNLHRLMKLKKAYMEHLLKKSRHGVMKISLIRNYESLGIKKKISEVLFFYAEPYKAKAEDPAKDTKESAQLDKLKQAFLLKKNNVVLGDSLQKRLQKVRNEFERSNILYSLDFSFDLILGYSLDQNRFFLETCKAEFENVPEMKEPIGGVEIDSSDLRNLVGELKPEQSLTEPKDGLWLLIPKQSEVLLANNSLISYEQTVARISNERIHIAL